MDGAAARQEEFSASLAPPLPRASLALIVPTVPPSVAVTSATQATGAAALYPAPLTTPAPAAAPPPGTFSSDGDDRKSKGSKWGTTWMTYATGCETEFMS